MLQPLPRLSSRLDPFCILLLVLFPSELGGTLIVEERVDLLCPLV